ALAPLCKLAEECDLAALGLIHWNKGQSTDALTRLSGSVGFSAAARSVLAFGMDSKDPRAEEDGTRILAHAKTNLGQLAPSVEYRLEGVKLEETEIETVRIRKIGESPVHVAQLLTVTEATAAQTSRLDDAKTFLKD